VPPGSGTRIGVDRDGDGFFDRTELDAGSNPADPGSIPGGTTTTTTTTTSTTTSTTTTTLPGPPTVLIPTRTLLLKDDVVAPVNPGARKLSFKTNTRTSPPGNRVVLPAFGGPGDPTLHGAVLTVYNSSGATTDEVSVSLPAGGWSRLGSSGYRFRGTDPNGPVSKVTLRADSISVKGGKANWTYTLDEPAQDEVAVRLQLGSAPVWCAEAQAKASGNPPSTATNDKPGRFVGARSGPPFGSCPATP
jgi:hypothetical protein